MKGEAAIEAVARHFSATWEKGRRDICVTIGGKHIAIGVMIVLVFAGGRVETLG